MTRPVASVRRTDISPTAGPSRAARHREIARRHLDAVAEARALVVDLIPAPTGRRRKYEDLDALGAIIAASGRKPARAAWARAITARNELVVDNLRIADGESRPFAGTTHGDEVRQEAYAGLIEAAKRYDPDNEASFVTYAAWWIRARVRRSLTALQPVKVSQQAAYEAGLAAELRDRGMSDEEVADEMNLSVERVRDLWGAFPDLRSLDDRADGEGRERKIHELLADEEAPDEGERIERIDTGRRAGRLYAVLRTLTARERRVIVERFGLDGKGGRALSAIGRDLGISRQRVQQIERMALDAVRCAMATEAA